VDQRIRKGGRKMPIPQGKKRKKKKVNEREIKVEEIQGKTIWEAKT